MKKLIIILTLFLQFSCGKTDCEQQLDDVVSARSNYNATQTEASCIAYRNQIEKFLEKPCTINEQVNYASIFSSELKKLPCYAYNTIEDPCVLALKNILSTGKTYNASSTTQNCEAYKVALESYINQECLNYSEYQTTLQSLPCY